MRRLGSRSRSRCSRSRQSRESGGRKGSCGEGGRQFTHGPAPQPPAQGPAGTTWCGDGPEIRMCRWRIGGPGRAATGEVLEPVQGHALTGSLAGAASPLSGSLLGRLGLACLLCSHRGPAHNCWGRPLLPAVSELIWVPGTLQSLTLPSRACSAPQSWPGAIAWAVQVAERALNSGPSPPLPTGCQDPSRPTSITRLLRIFSSSSVNDLEAKGGCPKRASVEGRQRPGWEGIGSSPAWPTPWGRQGDTPQGRVPRAHRVTFIRTLQEWPRKALPEDTQ